jgi:sugar lactone lactonase YvrE
METSMTGRRALVLAVAAWCALAGRTEAWDREHVGTFAVLPDGSGGPEGLEVDPHGNVYVASFGFTAAGPLTGEGQIFVFDRAGRLLRQLSLAGASPHLLGLRWQAATGKLLAADFGNQQVIAIDPVTGSWTPFMTLPALPHPGGASLNDITFDEAGNVYVSDSFQGIVWRTGSTGGVATAWTDHDLLRTAGVPPFGANGLRFNHAETALFVANTGNDAVVKIPVHGGVPGTPELFVNGINGADGLVLDAHDNLWVVANQADEIVVVDPTGRAIAKLGDFGGVRKGKPRQLLFPASLRFSGERLLVTNLALDLRLFDPLFVTVDSAWCAQVSRYTVSVLPARIPHPGDRRGHGGRDDEGDDRGDDRGDGGD